MQNNYFDLIKMDFTRKKGHLEDQRAHGGGGQ